MKSLQLLGVLWFLLGIFAALGEAHPQEKQSLSVATVNGAPLLLEEVQLWNPVNRAAAYRDYKALREMESLSGLEDQKLSPVPDSHLKTAEELLFELSLKDAIRAKIILQIAHENGLVATVNLREILENRSDVNQGRTRAQQEGKIIFGPVRYTEHVYLAHFITLLSFDIERLQKLSQLRSPDWLHFPVHDAGFSGPEALIETALKQANIRLTGSTEGISSNPFETTNL